MTRFKELSRIESAIEHKDESELKWALAYCEMRLRLALQKQHMKTWRNRGQAVKKAMQELKQNST